MWKKAKKHTTKKSGSGSLSYFFGRHPPTTITFRNMFKPQKHLSPNTYHQEQGRHNEKIYETYQKLAKMYTLSIGLAKLCRLSCCRTSVAVYYFHFQTLLRIYRMIDFEIVNMSFKSHKKITLFSSLNSFWSFSELLFISRIFEFLHVASTSVL